jgi:cold shock CspA family protein
MKGIVSWYSDRKKQGYIEGNDGTNIMVYEKDVPFLTILHAGDAVEYAIKKTTTDVRAINIKKIL